MMMHRPLLLQERHQDAAVERISLMLLRDPQRGLGFSIAGGKGTEPYIEGSHAVYVSKVAEDGPAARDGKLRVGDKLVEVLKHL